MWPKEINIGKATFIMDFEKVIIGYILLYNILLFVIVMWTMD